MERRFGDTFDPRRVGRLAALGIVGKPDQVDGVLRRAVAGDADQVQAERLPSLSSRVANSGS